MKTNRLSRALTLVALTFVAIFQLAACGGGGGSGSSGSATVTGSNTDTGSAGSGDDTISPAIALSAPTSGTTYAATTSTVTVTGTVTDDIGLSGISWTCSNGESGTLTATGTSVSLNFAVVLANGSNLITITATDLSGNTKQYQLTVDYAAQESSGTVTLVWDAVVSSDLSGYRVYYGTSTGSYQRVHNVGTLTTYTISGLTTGVRYYFAVSTLGNSGTESGYSNEISMDVF